MYLFVSSSWSLYSLIRCCFSLYLSPSVISFVVFFITIILVAFSPCRPTWCYSSKWSSIFPRLTHVHSLILLPLSSSFLPQHSSPQPPSYYFHYTTRSLSHKHTHVNKRRAGRQNVHTTTVTHGINLLHWHTRNETRPHFFHLAFLWLSTTWNPVTMWLPPSFFF